MDKRIGNWILELGNKLMNRRLYYLDYLRVALTVLVIIHHTAIAYGAGGSWIYEDVDKSELTISMILLTIFTAINQSFFMGFFFFLSGYFTPKSYDRKGSVSFLKDRFVRLGIPLLVYVLLLGPVITYVAHFRKVMSLSAYYQSQVLTLKTIHIGPLWFVETLLYFNILYAVFRLIRKRKFPITIKALNSKLLLYSGILLGLIAFGVRLMYPVGEGVLGLQFGYFPSYIFLFIAGMVAYRQSWLEKIKPDLVKKWGRIAVMTIPLLPIALILDGALEGNLHFEGGLNIQSFVYSMWEPFVAFGMILMLLQYFEQKVHTPNPFKQSLADSAYTVYIIHPVVIVGLSLLLTGIGIYPTVKFVMVSLIGTILCFAISWIIIKIPFANRVL
ncbi:acyltransferase [Bacillus sp. BGMRC 2118]|nr:acyltransferase [Bacillus sp. BGMRC 2118]